MNRPQARPLHPLRSHKSLEMTMRDTLEGLQEVACQSGFQPFDDCLQILSIETPREETPASEAREPSILPFFSPERSNNVLDFLLLREATP